MLIGLMVKKEKESKTGDKDGLKKVKEERDEYLDGWKRAKADLINYKKEELKRLEEVVKFANEAMIGDLIVVLDSFELALATLDRKDSHVEKGMYMIRAKLEDVMERRGLEKIEVEVGQEFDPNYHEAVDVVDGGKEKSNTIAEEVGTGYKLHGKVIRASRVKVYK